MKAILQKLSANTSEKKDSIQFRINEEEMEKNGQEILDLRRYHYVTVSAETNQSSISEKGTIEFPRFEFQAIATSISVCVTEEGLIVTLTFSIDDNNATFKRVIANDLRGSSVNIEFEEGENPFIDHDN